METKKNKTDKRTQHPPIPASPVFLLFARGINRCSLRSAGQVNFEHEGFQGRRGCGREDVEERRKGGGGGSRSSSTRERRSNRRDEGSRVTLGETVRGRFRVPSSPTANKGSLLRPLSQPYNLKQAVKASIRMPVCSIRAGTVYTCSVWLCSRIRGIVSMLLAITGPSGG